MKPPDAGVQRDLLNFWGVFEVYLSVWTDGQFLECLALLIR